MGGPGVGIRAAAEASIVAAAALVAVVSGVCGAPTWCIARSGEGAAALQAGLDYACGSGVADCTPLQPSGLCYLPNTVSSHASYAFNSYYQRSNAAPGACDFAGTATVTVTDPSYGSCSYPSSARTAGGSITTSTTPSTSTPSNTPTTFVPPATPTFGSAAGGVGGLSPGLDVSTSMASSPRPILLATGLCFVPLLL